LRSSIRWRRSYHFFFIASLPLLLIVGGTLGYQFVEGWPVRDALYMTVITLTTVGYREVHELSPAGENFTMVLALGGVFTLFYAATTVIAAIVSGEVTGLLGSRRMERQLSHLHGHLIVCGFGRMGRLVCEEFSRNGLGFVIVDHKGELFEGFDIEHGIPLHGDATSDSVLERAGVKRARALVSVVESDSDNLYITMSSRLLNDKLFIVSRAEDHNSEQKMLRAGASRVVSPYLIGGARVAQAVLRPAVVDFLELATRSEHLELNIEETQISPASRLAGHTLELSGLRDEKRVIVVAVKKMSGKMTFNPTRETQLEAGDTLIMLGRRPDLNDVAELARG